MKCHTWETSLEMVLKCSTSLCMSCIHYILCQCFMYHTEGRQICPFPPIAGQRGLLTERCLCSNRLLLKKINHAFLKMSASMLGGLHRHLCGLCVIFEGACRTQQASLLERWKRYDPLLFSQLQSANHSGSCWISVLIGSSPAWSWLEMILGLFTGNMYAFVWQAQPSANVITIYKYLLIRFSL